METQNTGAVYAQITSSRRVHLGSHRWLAGVAALTLVIGLGTIACSQLVQSQNTPSVPVPAAGNWVQVLTGYALTSLKAARSDPAVIYACATTYRQAGNARTPTGYAFLRSADFGAHWQNISSKLVLGGVCHFAINPADSNDLYFVNVTNNRQGPGVLFHSTDGGQNWNTITPVFQIPGLQSPIVWAPQDLTMEGNQLFALQAVPSSTVALPGQSLPPSRFPSLLHLLTSIDGGNNWTVLDSYLNKTAQIVSSYAVDPSSTDTIYEVVSVPRSPIQPVGRLQNGTPIPVPPLTPGSALYKTTDGGSNWQQLQQGLPFGAQVQLAIDKPNLVYLSTISGGGAHPLGPLAVAGPNATGSTFQLSMSSNGGATWSNVALPAAAVQVLRWFVGADGHVYLETGAYRAPIVVVTGTAVGRRIRPIPQSTPTQGLPDIGENPVTASDTPTPTPTDIPAVETVTVPGTPSAPTPPPTPPTLQVYDPASGNWSAVPTPISNVLLLAVTPAGSSSSAVLWLISVLNGNDVAYRNIV